MEISSSLLAAFAVALGGGMLIGIERERSKGSGPFRSPAGVRTFALTGGGGAFAQAIGEPWLVVAGAVMVMLLIALAYWRQRTDDPGVTTELALFMTYVLGVGAIDHTQLASGAFVVIAVLLASKERLHRFATQVLTEGEMRDGLILASAALIVAPLLPNQQLPYLAGANPSHLWRLVVLLMSLQAVGYIALRVSGARVGLMVAGLASGIVSSTSTMAAMGARAKKQPELVSGYVAGALCSNLSSMALLVPVAAAIHPPILKAIWPTLLAGMGAGLALAVMFARKRIDIEAGDVQSGPVFSISQAVGFSALLTVLTGAVALATDRYGMGAAELGAALAATVEMQAAVGSLFSLVAGGRIDASSLMVPLLIALSTNAAGKALIAFAVGGTSFGIRTGIGLFCTIAVMWLTLLV